MTHSVIPDDIIAAIKAPDGAKSSSMRAIKSDTPEPAKAQKTEATAKKKGGYPKGVSGNPKGRPKGALGKSTLVKQAIMAEAEGILLENAPKVIQTVVEQAKNGCTQSQKLIWSSLIPSKKAVEISAKDDGPAIIKINIETLHATNDKTGEAVDADFTVIEEEE